MRRVWPARLRVGGGECCVYARCWGWLFWLVQMRCNEGRDLKTGIKRQHAGALVLQFIVACSGGGAVANG